ncbi:MAG: farnesyl diphosphate synthase [bacterium]
MTITEYLKKKKSLIEGFLDKNLPVEDEYPEVIHKAMRYSVFAGGKRLRAILCLASNQAVSGCKIDILPIACALELIHTYSLIHDDLPAIDNDNLRRGKPTNHMVFGENIALLAGDALLTRAFELCTNAKLRTDILITIIREISIACGTLGMIGGQVVDILSEKKDIDITTLEYIHNHKTGRLISCAVRIGALANSCSLEELAALTRYSQSIGLAFQIVDDILDEIGDEKVMGKTKHSDSNKEKSTYLKVIGIEEARKKAKGLIDDAIESLAVFNQEAEPLRLLARYIIMRES